MAWTLFTLAELGLSARETALLDTHLPAGRAQAVLDTVLARVRGAARASGPINEEEGTLPPELRMMATAIVRHLVLIELPIEIAAGDGGQAEARRLAHDAALRDLERLSTGRLPIERPQGQDGEPGAAFAPRWSARVKRFDGASQAGA